jgi:hypothetical protein
VADDPAAGDDTSELEIRTAGMATGSDAGAPGEHLPEPPLDAAEQRLLAQFERPDDRPSLPAVEDSASMIGAVEDDGPLPATGGDTNDVEAARFQPPRIE